MSDETSKRTQRAKSLIVDIRHGRLRNKEEVEMMSDEIFRLRSSHEIENAATVEKILELFEETSKREEQLELWDKMRMRKRGDRVRTEDSTTS